MINALKAVLLIVYMGLMIRFVTEPMANELARILKLYINDKTAKLIVSVVEIIAIATPIFILDKFIGLL